MPQTTPPLSRSVMLGLILASGLFLMACPSPIAAPVDPAPASPSPSSAPQESADAARFRQALQVEAWSGEVSISVDSPASATDEDGTNWSHTIFRWARFSGELTPSGFLGAYWQLSSGSAQTEVRLESFATLGESTSRYTEEGDQQIDISQMEPQGYNTLDRGVFLVPDLESHSFILHIPSISQASQHRYYIDGSLEHQFPVVSILPGAAPAGIKLLPDNELKLSGSRTVRQLIFGAGGDAVELDVSISWEFAPQLVLPPLDPL